MRVVDEARLGACRVDRRTHLRGDCLVAAGGGGLFQSGQPGVAEILDVLPLVLDILAEQAQLLAARNGAVDRRSDGCREEIGWVGLHARQTSAPAPIDGGVSSRA